MYLKGKYEKKRDGIRGQIGEYLTARGKIVRVETTRSKGEDKLPSLENLKRETSVRRTGGSPAVRVTFTGPRQNGGSEVNFYQERKNCSSCQAPVLRKEKKRVDNRRGGPDRPC